LGNVQNLSPQTSYFTPQIGRLLDLIFSYVYGKLKSMKRYFFLIILALFVLPSPSYCQTAIKVLAIQENIINPVTADRIEKALKEIEGGDTILILKIDTPGGLLKSTERIVKLLLNSPNPIITYIYPKGGRAASAGTFIGYASHILAMSPSTHIGAAHPVIGGGSWGNIDEEMQKKIMNDTIAWAENISQTRKRPFKFLKDAIEESISITEVQALKKGVSDLTAVSLDELIRKIDGLTVETTKGKIKLSTKDSQVEEIPLTSREKFLDTIIDPNIAYLLLTLGFLGLIFEVTHSGFGFPGIAGVICLILSFYALSVLPVNYAGLTLIILGITFFIVEAFTPAFGLFTLGGVAAFFLGSVMLFNQPQLVKVSYTFILPLVLALAGLSLFILGKVIATLRLKPRVGQEALIGREATALTSIRAKKSGKVFLEGGIWIAQADEKINKGQVVIVTKASGLRLHVRLKKEAEVC